MGRKSLSLKQKCDINNVSYQNLQKSKHRVADTKYRRNVQILYDFLREILKEDNTKDCLLNSSIDNIAKMEMNIVCIAGQDALTNHKKTFLRLLEIEHEVWRCRNPQQWWKLMHNEIQQKIEANTYGHIGSNSEINSE